MSINDKSFEVTEKGFNWALAGKLAATAVVVAGIGYVGNRAMQNGYNVELSGSVGPASASLRLTNTQKALARASAA